MAKSGSEHSVTTLDAISISTQSELLSSKYQRKAKLLKSFTQTPSPTEDDTARSTVVLENGGSHLTTTSENSRTAQPHGTTTTPEAGSEGTKMPDQDSKPSSMRDEPRPMHVDADEDNGGQHSDSQPPPPPSYPDSDMATTGTATPRYLSPPPENESPPPQKAAPAVEVDMSGLPHLSAAELDHAKNLVLDLLGWGVSPEYLVSLGLSPQLVYRVFADLNLRLPKNLRVTDTVMDGAYLLGRNGSAVASKQP